MLLKVMERGETDRTVGYRGREILFRLRRSKICYIETPPYVADQCHRMSMLTVAVYIYPVILDSENGVSSTRSTSVAALDFQQGEIRQIQFLEDGTVMLLTSDDST